MKQTSNVQEWWNHKFTYALTFFIGSIVAAHHGLVPFKAATQTSLGESNSAPLRERDFSQELILERSAAVGQQPMLQRARLRHVRSEGAVCAVGNVINRVELRRLRGD